MIRQGWTLTFVIMASALALSLFLWSIGIYFFFLPIIFLPFLRYMKFKYAQTDNKTCPLCNMVSEGNYCPQCGTKL